MTFTQQCLDFETETPSCNCWQWGQHCPNLEFRKDTIELCKRLERAIKALNEMGELLFSEDYIEASVAVRSTAKELERPLE